MAEKIETVTYFFLFQPLSLEICCLCRFEIGGKNKTFTQIKDIHNSFLGIDDISMGVGNRIPLWIFGFLY